LTDDTKTQAALLELAATLYDRELISLGRAARIAGLSYAEMSDELGPRVEMNRQLMLQGVASSLTTSGSNAGTPRARDEAKVRRGCACWLAMRLARPLPVRQYAAERF
jgi:hypothetical protein